MNDIMSVISLVISGLALFFSLYQFAWENRRKKKQDTLEAYNQLQTEVFSEVNVLDKDLQENGKNICDEDIRPKVTNYLARIERFSVGVSCGIYSYRILKRCGGAYFCRRYFFFEPVINEKRKRSNAGNHYDEFEKLAIRLKKDYEKKSKTKYDWNAPIAKEDLEITFVSEIENAVFIPSESCTTNVP